ncbi:CBO0543 family protein [Paenibacillus sp. Root444D2]|uniref:CBO0543 family protein n=1 Tax=Paenibacillus sp. Root444D2 TaxID=1736538 RepID=UPI003FA6CB4B
MYISILFSRAIQSISDIYLDLGLNLYGYFAPGVEWLTLIPVFGLYPAFTIIYLNYFPFKSSLLKKCIYIILYSICATIFEWLSVKSGYFYYNHWKLWYSAIIYPGLLIILPFNLYILRRIIKLEYHISNKK